MYKHFSELQSVKNWMSEHKDLIFLAGGTDLVPLFKDQVKTPDNLCDLHQIRKLCGINKTSDNRYSIGSMVTLSELGSNEEIHNFYLALWQAANATASLQIRNIGTLGGNIMQDRRCIYFNQTSYWRSSIAHCYKTGGSVCHQSPKEPQCRAIYYSDMATALCALGASVLVYDGTLEKEMSIKELISLHSITNGTLKRENLLLEKFFLPCYNGSVKSNFQKVSIRSSIDFPTVNFAGIYFPETASVRLYAGAVSHVPIHLEDTENYIHTALLSNDNKLSIDLLTDCAVTELKKKCRLVREATISAKIKKDAFFNIRNLFKNLFSTLI